MLYFSWNISIILLKGIRCDEFWVPEMLNCPQLFERLTTMKKEQQPGQNHVSIAQLQPACRPPLHWLVLSSSENSVFFFFFF